MDISLFGIPIIRSILLNFSFRNKKGEKSGGYKKTENSMFGEISQYLYSLSHLGSLPQSQSLRMNNLRQKLSMVKAEFLPDTEKTTGKQVGK